MSATKSTIYVEGIGRRKTATARVRLTPAKASEIVVNDTPVATYFKSAALQQTVSAVFATPDAGIEHYQVSAHVVGGGLTAQAEAIRLGIARALVREKAARRKPLKREGFLMRDQRSVERKKFGLRKARKRPQWSKR
jgi:small subunit ribosomal protein S9